MPAMSPTFIWIGIISLLVVLLAIVFAATYNRLVTLRQRYLNAYAQIDVQLKRRYDLIPNLVETVKGYMAHERQTLESVIAARNAISAVSRSRTSPTRMMSGSWRIMERMPFTKSIFAASLTEV